MSFWIEPQYESRSGPYRGVDIPDAGLEPIQGLPSLATVPWITPELEEVDDEYMEVEPMVAPIYRSEHDDEPRSQRRRELKSIPGAIGGGSLLHKREVLTPPKLTYHQSPYRSPFIDDTEPQQPEVVPPYDALPEHVEGGWRYTDTINMPAEFMSSPNPSLTPPHPIRAPRSEPQLTYQSLTHLLLAQHDSQYGSLHHNQRPSPPRTVRNPDPPSPTEGSGTVNANSPRFWGPLEPDPAPWTPYLSPPDPARRPTVTVQSPTGSPIYIEPRHADDYAGMYSPPRTVRNPDPASPTESCRSVNADSPQFSDPPPELEPSWTPYPHPLARARRRRPTVTVRSPTGSPIYYEPQHADDYAGMYSPPRTVRNPDPASPTESCRSVNADSPRVSDPPPELEPSWTPYQTYPSPLAQARRPTVTVQSPTGSPIYIEPRHADDYAGMDMDSLEASGDPTQQIANCLSSPGSGSGPGQQPTGLYPVVERSGQHNGSSLHQAPINQAQPRRGIPTPQQTSATPQSNLTQISSRVSVNGLPPNGVLAQINSVPPQQSPQFTPPLSQQPIEPNGLSRILTPPDTLHPTLSCWIKNMNKLSSLIDRLQELASAASAEHRSQLLRQVVALRTTFKKQQEHCMEFLTLSDEYANKYLLDISDEIQRQSSFLDKLEERLETAKKLRREAVDLQILYESGTVATMKNFRATALPRPLPEDDALFSEVDLVLTEIRQCYMELDKFWTEEISRAIEALKMRRVDPTDFERWKSFHVNLKQTIESWKNELPSGGAQIPPCNNTSSSKDADIGAIASSMSSVMGSLTSALECVTSSNSLKYLPSGTAIGRSSMQRVYVAFVSNNDLCFSFLQKCADYGEKAIGWRLPPIASPTSLRVMASHDLRERTMRCMRLRSKMTHVSVENAASVQGSRKFTAAYNKALSLEKKTTSGLNILIEKISSWVVVTDGHGLSDDVHPDVISLEQVRELWEKAGYSVRAALAILKNEPAPQLLLPSAPLASTRLRSVMKRWMTKLVCFL